MSGAPKDIGLILKEERERRNLTIDMVHDVTKIPMDSLKAIEEGYKVRTLSPFYYKSFVRIYAQYLNLDLNTLLSGTPLEKPPATHVPVPVRAVKSPSVQSVLPRKIFHRSLYPSRYKTWLKFFGAALVAVAVLSLVIAAVKRAGSRAPETSVAGAGVADRGAGKELEKKAVRKETVAPEPRPVQNTRSPAKPPAEPKAGAVEPRVPKAEPRDTGDKSPYNVTVAVRAKSNSWLNVKVDGVTVFQTTLKKGAVQAWNAKKTIDISGRNMDELDIEVNGKAVGRLGRRNMKVKKVRITPEGLSVEK
jgi:cytoskeletal protein RodZ